MPNRNKRATRQVEQAQKAAAGRAVIDPRQKVLVSCTTQGSMRKETARALATLFSSAEKYRMELALVDGKPYESFLNIIAQKAQEGDFDWWLHTDDDQSWNSSPLKAIGAMKDVVVFPTPVFRPGGTQDLGAVFGFNTFKLAPFREEGSDKVEERFSLFSAQKGMHRVDMFGTGSFLIRVPVLEKLKAWLSDCGRSENPVARGAAEKRGPFSRVFDDRGIQVEDVGVAFCRRCREAGIELWADFDCVCSHWQDLDMLQLMGMMRRMRNDVLEKLQRQVGLEGFVSNLSGDMKAKLEQAAEEPKGVIIEP